MIGKHQYIASLGKRGCASCGADERDSSHYIDCEICGNITSMFFTKRCNRCWELEHRIHADPEIAQKILNNLPKGAMTK